MASLVLRKDMKVGKKNFRIQVSGLKFLKIVVKGNTRLVRHRNKDVTKH